MLAEVILLVTPKKFNEMVVVEQPVRHRDYKR